MELFSLTGQMEESTYKEYTVICNFLFNILLLITYNKVSYFFSLFCGADLFYLPKVSNT